MKQTLLFLFMLVCSLSQAQAPINDYTNNVETNYYVVTGGIDHSSNGANVTWNFTSLTQNDNNTETYASPTSGEASTYPGTTSVLTITTLSSPATPNSLFLRNNAGEISLTGASTTDLEINYNTDNATFGTFPLSYTFTNTDAVAGTFNYLATGTSGTFSGTLATSVDAYGTLNLNNLGTGSYSGDVTRLRTEQNLNLSAFPLSGTVNQVTYNYYDDMTGKLIFRSTTTSFSVPLLGINDTVTTHEAILDPTLSISNHTTNNTVSFYPNPVKEVLVINSNNTVVNLLEVYDINGRKVLAINHPQTHISLNGLDQGVYIVKAHSDQKTFTKKLIKQ